MRYLSPIVVGMYYLALGPVAWAYLNRWITPEQWVFLTQHWFQEAVDFAMEGRGGLHVIYVAWLLFWESLA